MASPRILQLCRNIIKPSSQTPSALQTYKLSRYDQVSPGVYIPMAFFYPKNTSNRIPNSLISQLLQDSLSKCLSTYYPFAGILKGNDHVSCTDKGVTFVETEIECPMSHIFNNNDVGEQNDLFPKGIPWSCGSEENTLLYAQINHFSCGGRALSVCVTHKISDACTMANFIRHWAAVARESGDGCPPVFNGASMFPPIDDCDPLPQLERKGGVITKRFVFDESNIKELKEIGAAESGVEKPTRVEVVTSLISKAAMSASMEFSRSFKPSMICHPANIRSLMNPPIPQTSFGNANTFYSFSTNDEGDIKFGRSIYQLRKSKEKMLRTFRHGNHFSAIHESFQEVLTHPGGVQDFDIYAFSSISNFGLLQMDFGWGKPVRMNFGAAPFKNYILFGDDRHGTGIEAVVTLEEGHMSFFENNAELLRYTSSGFLEH